MVQGTAGTSQAKQQMKSRAHPQGNPRAAAVPQRCRPGLSEPVAHVGHAVGGRKPAHPAGSQIGSGLTGVLYVLDEPSIGLHQRDNARLLQTLSRLRDLGNTVIVVEHDEDAIRRPTMWSTWGPRAGVHGGDVVAEGTPKEIMRAEGSITGRLSDRHARESRCPPAPQGNGKTLKSTGATRNNLQT